MENIILQPKQKSFITENNTILLMHMNNTDFLDECGHTVYNRGVTLDTNISKFGGGSAFFNYACYFDIALHKDFYFGTSELTVDWWEYRNNSSTVGAAFHAGNGFYGLLLHYSLMSYVSSGYAGWDIGSDKPMGPLILNTWQHIAFVRKGKTFYSFVDGTLKATWTITNDLAIAPPLYIYIGKGIGYLGSGAWIDEFRISNIARWTANFTPPNTQYDV